MKHLKFILTGMFSLFNMHTFSTPIYDRIKPNIEIDDKKAFEKDKQALKGDFERAWYEFQQRYK